MDQIGWIRRLHRRENKSEREISRMTGLSRNTVVSARPAAFLPKRSGRVRSSAAGWLRSAASTAVA
jgi:hypothetical protein